MATGGAGGIPNGAAGSNSDIGTNDYSSGNGGTGGSTPFGAGGRAGDTSGVANPPYYLTTAFQATNPGGATTNSTGTSGNGPGAGGGGAGFADRTSPLNWAGGDGFPGFVAISWGGSPMPTAAISNNINAVVAVDTPTLKNSAAGQAGAQQAINTVVNSNNAFVL